MAISNIKKKIAALAELRKDPAAAIERAWASVRTDAIAETGDTHEADVDLVEQIIGAVVADIREAAKPVTPAN